MMLSSFFLLALQTFVNSVNACNKAYFGAIERAESARRQQEMVARLKQTLAEKKANKQQ